MIQSFKLLSWRHKRPEEDKGGGETEASVFTFSLSVHYRFHQVPPQLCADLEKSGQLKTIRAQLLQHKACCDINERKNIEVKYREVIK